MIWDYPVVYPYGYSAAYGPNFHTGEDRPAPLGTSVPVNGVVIGLVGSTGLSTGNHLHIGKWNGGQHYPPAGGGQTLGQDAIVTQVDNVGNTNNGKFVRINSGGFDYVYLHLSKVNVTVGQRLQGGDMGAAEQARIRQLEESEQRLAKEVVARDNALVGRDQRIRNLEASEQNLAQEVVARDKKIAALEANPVGDFQKVGEIDGKPVYRPKS